MSKAQHKDAIKEWVISRKPEFLGDPREVYVLHLSSPATKAHQFACPENGEEIMEAIGWMMCLYDDVKLEYGETYGVPYCHLVGKVRQ